MTRESADKGDPMASEHNRESVLDNLPQTGRGGLKTRASSPAQGESAGAAGGQGRTVGPHTPALMAEVGALPGGNGTVASTG